MWDDIIIIEPCETDVIHPFLFTDQQRWWCTPHAHNLKTTFNLLTFHLPSALTSLELTNYEVLCRYYNCVLFGACYDHNPNCRGDDSKGLSGFEVVFN